MLAPAPARAAVVFCIGLRSSHQLLFEQINFELLHTSRCLRIASSHPYKRHVTRQLGSASAVCTHAARDASII